ncbi:transglutaminase-like putative cysteine protease [Microbacterium terrae]|uniref:Transglutaminase-like superfamily protein n=1 Tax=Microbacterium terrae TaxID=69369 RepID=A0A0M2H625_9MICO|nr:transglutaminase family protein [Microbacterium terrae]KJL39491.1 Transglutaminase-like superfamily protein [Microbacterium terrae]MBP1078083.1 transglutaminase-like putative cysteine protease [Microbacterium terrae]
MQRDVSSRIVLNVTEEADLVFAVAVAGHYAPNHEHFTATIDGAALPVAEHELFDAHGTRLHRLTSPPGELVVDYGALVLGAGDTAIAHEADLLTYARPSRYAESDMLLATAAAEFGGIDDPRELLTAVSSWVGTRLVYVPGSSLPTDGAVRTLLARQGVCRDYAHLCVALLRSRGVPARVAAVYAPGLAPMDFHAVAEAWVDDAWCVVDATTLAPRSTLVRIATGRDAADTAFLTVMSGRTTLVDLTVTATVDSLPADDLEQRVSIA